MEELRKVRTGKQFFWSQGTVALSEGRFAEAAEAFRQMVAADPEEPIAHMDLGTALLQLGDVSGALARYQESLRLSPGNPRLHYNLGLVYTLQKAYPKALEHYQQCHRTGSRIRERSFQCGQSTHETGETGAGCAALSSKSMN